LKTVTKKQVVFADRLTNVSVHNGLVRIDLASFANATQDKEGKPAIQFEVTHQLVMPLEGFAAAVSAQENVLKELAAMEQRRRDAAAAPKAEATKAAN